MAAASPSAGSAATAALSRSIYDAMLSQNKAGLKLKLDIVDTLFLDECVMSPKRDLAAPIGAG